jgi:formylglycine-generating enzyme required for sulfatase activity
MTNRQLRVFLCHSSKDKTSVRELYKKLRAEAWLDPWLDEEKLLPGQDWHMEIEKAVEVTDVVVVLLSNQSVSQEGYVQRELKLALDVADEKPESTIFIVPLRLDDCPAPRRLRGWHYVDYFPADRKDWAVERLITSLKARAESLGLKFEKPTPPKINETPVGRVSDPTIIVSHEESQAKSLTYETPVQNKKPVIETPKPVKVITLPKKLVLSNGMEFMRVPAGKFLMGSDNGAADETPQHTVDIPYDYWMARYPVTNEQYNMYVSAKGIVHPVLGWEAKKDHPIVFVKWKETIEYCKWLNNLLKVELPSEMIVRLPTESEWEKAVRGTDGRKYPWGNEFDKNKCNTGEDGIGVTTPIGLYSPHGDSPYGCADMAGFFWTWTHSEYKAYPYNAKDGREDEQKNVSRVLRGGSCNYKNWGMRSGDRRRGNPGDAFGNLVFRVVVCMSSSL